MVPARNKVKRLSSANYTTKTIHHYHHHHHQKRQLHWTICIETEANTELSLLEKNMITEKGKQLNLFWDNLLLYMEIDLYHILKDSLDIYSHGYKFTEKG